VDDFSPIPIKRQKTFSDKNFSGKKENGRNYFL